MSEENGHCDDEGWCKNYNVKCLWCVREYENEFEETDYFVPKEPENACVQKDGEEK